MRWVNPSSATVSPSRTSDAMASASSTNSAIAPPCALCERKFFNRTLGRPFLCVKVDGASLGFYVHLLNIRALCEQLDGVPTMRRNLAALLFATTLLAASACGSTPATAPSNPGQPDNVTVGVIP